MSLKKTSARFWRYSLLAVLCFVLVNQTALADFRFELSESQGYNQNLLLDSNNIDDGYLTAGARIKYYPIASLELSAEEQQTFHGQIYDLSNTTFNFRGKYIWANTNSPLAVMATGGYKTQRYYEEFSGFDNNTVDFSLSCGYQIREGIQIRSGFNYSDMSYTKFETGNKTTSKFVVGMNATVLKDNSVDLEIGYALMNLSYMKEPGPGKPYYLDPLFESYIDGKLKSLYISPRISRQIGDKLGISITYGYNIFTNDDSMVVSGLSTQYLSPWASVYEGQKVSLKFKSFLII